MLNKQLISICFFILFLLYGGGPIVSQVTTESHNEQTLTIYLRELSAKYGKRISFSPTVTDKVYLRKKDMAGSLEETLNKLLKGTNLKYSIVNGNYYIYKANPPINLTSVKVVPQKKPEKRKELPLISSVTPRLVFPDQRIVPDLKFHPRTLEPVHPTSPKLAIKTNLIYDITATVNLGIEFALTDKWTMDISGNLNYWNFSSVSRKWKHVLVQPELRYWPCERFSGHFVGLHLHTAFFNIGNLPTLGGLVSENMQQYRYQGYLYGGGFSYGYQWIVNNRWSIETSIGVGYAHVKYDKYPCGNCGRKIKNNSKNYFGPTKATISLIYSIK